MAKTTLKPYRKANILVEVETTEVLTEEEKEAVILGIREAFTWCCKYEPWPVFGEIQLAVKNSDPALAKKLINTKYC